MTTHRTPVNDVAHTLLRLGRLKLVSGAATESVQESVIALAQRLGYQANILVGGEGLLLTLQDGHGFHTKLGPTISDMTVNMSALAALDGMVREGQVSLSFYAVTGAVVQEVIERLGHAVEVKQGPHEEMFPLLGRSAIDLMAAAWLPEGHASYWAQYGQNAVEVAKFYDGARFFWGVPSYVPEAEVGSIADLANPVVAARIAKQIQGIGRGAAISTLSQKTVEAYGLDALGYSFRASAARRL